MGACGCFDNRKIISNNKNNNINEIIDQVEDSIIKLNGFNDDQRITQKDDTPIYENTNYIKNEKIHEIDTIGNELNIKKNHKKKKSIENVQNEDEKNDNFKNNKEKNKKNNKTRKNENLINKEKEKINNENKKNNNNEKEIEKENEDEKKTEIKEEKKNEKKEEKIEKKEEINKNENKQNTIKQKETEKENNENKNKQKKEEQNNENILIDNEDNENKIKKNINYKETKKSDNLNQNETDISLYRYPSNFEIIYQSSSILKGKREINIVLIGEKQSGKSSFVIKLAENRFENLYIPTVFIETISKVMTYNNKRYVLNFDVTPGEQEYQQDYSTLYAKSNFIFLFYDVTNLGSFLRAKKFIKKELKNKVVMYSHNFSNIFIIGNKIDSTPFIESSTQIRSYCEKHQLEFFEISVKTNAGIGYMMNKLLAIFDSISSI